MAGRASKAKPFRTVVIENTDQLRKVFEELFPDPTPCSVDADPLTALVSPNDPDVLHEHPGNPRFREED